MNGDESQAALLSQLRQAAEARDPERCQFLLKTLFMDMEFYSALAVVIERAQSFLETFEHYYPEGQFARQILTQMVNTGTAPSRLPPEAQRDFAYPGGANFMKALSDLAHALQPGPLPPRIGYLVEATVNAIMARTGRALLRTAHGGLADSAGEPAVAGSARDRLRLLDRRRGRPARYRSLAEPGRQRRGAASASVALTIRRCYILGKRKNVMTTTSG